MSKGVLYRFSEIWHSEDFAVMEDPRRPDEAEILRTFLKNNPDGVPAGLVFFQTSGSEGKPKWVGLKREAFRVSARAVNHHTQATEKDRWLLALPIHHVGGFSIPVRAEASGCAVEVFPHAWDAEAFAGFCEEKKITLTSLVPTQVHDVVHPNLKAPKSLRAVIVGGGHLSEDVALRAWQLGWPVITSYGMTEAASQIATLELPHEKQTPHNFGKMCVLEHWKVRVDEFGRLSISGDSLASGYLFAQEGSDFRWEEISSHSGFFARDRVQIETVGNKTYLTYLGRESGWVKILGELVHLDPIQAKLDKLVRESGKKCHAVILPVADARQEARLLLLSDAKESVAQELLKNFNNTQPGLTRIREVFCLREIPRSHLGKVDKNELWKMISATYPEIQPLRDK